MNLTTSRFLRIIAAIAIVLMLVLTRGAMTGYANVAPSTFEGGDGNLIVDTAGDLDWANVPGINVGIDQPSGSTDNAFGQGTKEDNPAVSVVDGSIPPNKSDLTRFYIANQKINGNIFLYLAWERSNVLGSANMDFEINQHPTTGFNGSFTGAITINRTPGDLLVTYDFTNGGSNPVLGLLTWVTSATIPSVPGFATNACYSANTFPCWGDHITLNASDSEGAINTTTVTDPVPPNAPRQLAANTFGEASINLTALNVFPSGSCEAFGSAYLKSRSSASFTAEVKDFVAPASINITNCSSIGTTLSSSSISAGDTIHDSATLSGVTSTAGGTVTYTVYKDNTCTTQAVAGTDISAQPGSVTVSNGSVPDSPGVTFNNAGTYYWQASYSGDSNNSPSSSACTSETVTVGKRSPTIGTTLSTTSTSIGTAVHDSATLTGATSNAGGSVTYTVYTDSGCSQNAVSAGTKTVTNGTVPNSDNVSFANAGTYYWQASYTGDSNNNSATSPCTSEQVVVGKNSPTIGTTLSTTSTSIGTAVHDSATLTGATSTAGGSVTYTVYSDSACSQNAVSAGTKTVTNATVPNSDNVSFSAAGTYYWQAVYTGDANNNGATSPCTSEQVVVGKNSPTIGTTLSTTSTSIGSPVHDSATLTGATSNAGGTVTYTVYSNNSCSQNAVSAGTKTVTNGTVPNSDDVSFANAGTYYWQAVYSGDSNNNGATSTCTSEQVVVGKNSPTIGTTLSTATASIGQSIHDSATLTGATSTAGGTVTYTAYSDSACTLNAVSAGTKTVTNGVVPDSNSISFANAGTYYWQASYSGDSNNNAATSLCTSEQVVVGKNSPTIGTTLSTTSTSIGTAVHDTATLTGATGTAGGTVSYTVYTDSGCSQNAVSAGTKTVTNGTVPNSDNVSFSAAGTYYWQAVYSGDANNNGATSTCTSEQVVVGKNSPTIGTTLSTTSTSIGTAVHDSATLTGATSNAGGTVTYTVYTDSGCSQNAVSAGTKTVTNGTVPNSDNVSFSAAGTYYWQAVYSGDANNNGATSLCTSEQLVVGKNGPSMTTAQSLTPNDSSTLSGATSNAGGSITFNLYSPSDATCSGTPALTQTVSVSGNGTYNTTNTTFIASAVGTWRWQVTYSGDANNNGKTSACGVENFSITNG